ncbi:MAG: NVEALA domain-containing protein [Tannerella sp.]|nr:NVEALA domain-containing protein [Tannerella sp.]
MKRTFFYASVVAIVTVAGWNVMQSRNDAVLSDIALANIEALADESGSGGSSCYCVMHVACYNSSGTATGNQSTSSYYGPGCSRSHHSHSCSGCKTHTQYC